MHSLHNIFKAILRAVRVKTNNAFFGKDSNYLFYSRNDLLFNDIIKIIPTVTCSKGWFSNGKVCEICPKNTYQDIAAQTTCQKCPNGTNTIGIGSTSEKQCVKICTVPQIYFGASYPPSNYEVYLSSSYVNLNTVV